MRRRRKSDARVNHERWLISYADFITLLFAVFVVLYASSVASKKKQAELAQAMQHAFAGGFGKTVTGGSGKGAPLPGEAAAAEALLRERRLREALARSGAEQGMPAGSVLLHTTPEGLVISLRETGFFGSGAAEVKPTALPLLVELAQDLPDGAVRVEGHTDDVPIRNAQFPSNWELSGGRAATIARILLEHGRVGPGEMAAVGLAEFHPVAANDTEEGRAQNRRVDVIVLRGW